MDFQLSHRLQNDGTLHKKAYPMDIPENQLPWSHIYIADDLPARKTTRFTLEPDTELRAEIARDLELSGLTKLTFSGELQAAGRSGWVLNARLGASVVQPCVVSLEPVKTRIDQEVLRHFMAELPEQDHRSETEIPDDVSIELLPDAIDVGNVMVEALLLHLPMFPRALDIEPINITVTEPGVKPMTREDMRPFSGLKSLRDKLENPDT